MADSIACNREAFLSEDGCDRGSVDIHRFDELPYCESVSPTPPAIPPEVIDTPIHLNIPPPCACIDVETRPSIGYGRGFGAGGGFKAKGDCCEGKYVSNINLSIPCPVNEGAGGRTSGTVTVSVQQGTAKAQGTATAMTVNTSNCKVTPVAGSMNLNLPCSTNVKRGQITIGMGWGEGKTEQTETYLPTQKDTCNIAPLSPKFNLSLPCPISSEVAVAASVKYGRGANRDEKTILKKGSGCTLQPVPNELSLDIPCPVVTRGNAGILLEYTSHSRPPIPVPFINANPAECTITPMNVRLRIPCPIYADNKVIKPYKLKIKPVMVPLPPEQIPSNSVSFIEANSVSCTIKPKDVKLELKIPCPIVSNGKLKVKVDYKKNAASSFSTGAIVADKEKCTVNIGGKGDAGGSVPFRMVLKCPTEESFLGIRTEVRPNPDSKDSVGKFSCSSVTVGCHRQLNFKITFPRTFGGGGGGTQNCPITGMRFGFEDGWFKAFINRTCTSSSSSVKICRMHTLTLVTDTKYFKGTTNNFAQRKVSAAVLFQGSASPDVGSSSNKYETVFQTVPLSEES